MRHFYGRCEFPYLAVCTKPWQRQTRTPNGRSWPLISPFPHPFIFSWWQKTGAWWIKPLRDTVTFSILLIKMEEKFKSPQTANARARWSRVKDVSLAIPRPRHKHSLGDVIFKVSTFNGTEKWPLWAGSPNAVLSYLHRCRCAVIFSWLHISSFSFVSSSPLCHTIKRERGAWRPSVHRAGIVTV